MDMMTASDLNKTYRLGNENFPILKNVSLSVTQGEFLVIQGNSGSGKTTLLSLLSGLDRPTSGQVLIDGRDITRMTEDELAPLRNITFGFVFQSFHLVPSLTAIENVMFPAELNGDSKAREKAVRLLERVGLQNRWANFPHQLSGGEKQRIAICRALINDPKILFADEPTGNLDSESGQAVLTLLSGLRSEKGAALILVTHSPEIARAADRVIRLRDGAILTEVRHDS
ncbi:MAG: ABC transporter ATP-binding protein [Pseudomonadota bacterium]